MRERGDNLLLRCSPSTISIRKTVYEDVKVICSAPEGRAGCLTDGKRWDFVYLKPALVRKLSRDAEVEVEGYEVYETGDLGSKTKEEIKKIMGIVPVGIQSVLTLRDPGPFRGRVFAAGHGWDFVAKRNMWLRRLRMRMRMRNGVVCELLEVTEAISDVGMAYVC